ncbi:MAG: hypothetical protein KC933_14110 [Myxococcales bacterium]|nr:hypothetical protein [Myxococcales bacterium]
MDTPRPLGALTLIVTMAAAGASSQARASEAPQWRWHQVLSIPRIGSRLRTITVDQRDPRRIFVGTEEGTLLKTTDGGVTWVEVELRPFVLYDRSLGLRSPGLPRLGATTPNNFKVYVDPPNQEFTDRIPIPSVADPFPIRPEFFFAGFLATGDRPELSFIWDVVRSRYRWVIPVRRVALCPGATYPVLVATKRDVFGSQDDGDTFVRLFANPGPVDISNLTCNAKNPNEVAVATGVGLFISRDGGLTFDQDLDAWPGQAATAVAYGVDAHGRSRLYSASGSEMFAGTPGVGKGMEYAYPTGDSSTAPWRDIWWIATAANGGVWLATEDGARFSADYGANWSTAARTLLSRQDVVQVQIGENEAGGSRVALMLNVEPVGGLQDSVVYSSDDGGNSWHPFFSGLSRRSLHQMDAVPATASHPAGWWVVTSGGVWTTYPAPPIRRPDPDARDWAQRRLAVTPSLREVLNATLDHTQLSNERIHGIANSHRALNWVPRLDMLFELGQQTEIPLNRRIDPRATPSQLISSPKDLDAPYTTVNWALFVQASWDLKDVIQLAEDFPPYRDTLHELRRQVAFAAEDAWHERVNLLRMLDDGLSDPFEIETLKARIMALEAMLDVWLGQSMAELGTFNREKTP